MTDPQRVKVTHSLANLFEKVTGHLFWDHPFRAFRFNVLVETDATHILLDEINFFRGLETINEPNHMWMLP